MYILSGRLRDEFLACPELVRFGEVDSHSRTVRLLVKTSTLAAKYLVRASRIQLAILRIGTFLLYGLQFADGDQEERIRWSLYEESHEIESLRSLVTETPLCIYVFTEVAVNIAFGTSVVHPPPGEFPVLLGSATPYPFRPDGVEERIAQVANEKMARLVDGTLPADEGCFVSISPPSDWNPVRNYLITNNASQSLVSLFDEDEGGQQESLAHWLSDNLDPDGAVRSPQVHSGQEIRELTDILLTYREGVFLIESKALSILSRTDLPTRSKLAANVVKHVRKAARQLVGASNSIRKGLAVTDSKGALIKVERSRPAHLIILIPDLELLRMSDEDWMSIYYEAMKASGGFLNILDPAELLRVAQAADSIAKRSKKITPMMALDYYLQQRTRHVIEVGHPDVNVLLRFDGETPGEAQG